MAVAGGDGRKSADTARKSKENVKWCQIAFEGGCRKFALVFVYIVQMALAIFAPENFAFWEPNGKCVKFNLHFAEEPDNLSQSVQKTALYALLWIFVFEMRKFNLLFEVEVRIKQQKWKNVAFAPPEKETRGIWKRGGFFGAHMNI